MNIKTLIERINLQEEVKKEVISFSSNFDFNNVEDIIKLISNYETGKAGIDKLEEYFKEDDKLNYKKMSVVLYACALAYDKYKELGIDDKIYFDTMSVFVRFINEAKEKNGKYSFDRLFWVFRQPSLSVFRIDDLEFEMHVYDNRKIISLHIPSNSNFTDENVSKSLKHIKEFVHLYFSDYDNAIYACHSWLLSSQLKDILDKDSNILAFQRRFIMMEQFEGEFITWIFHRPNDTDIDLLPLNTTLQKGVYKLLKEGKKFTCGFGLLEDYLSDEIKEQLIHK